MVSNKALILLAFPALLFGCATSAKIKNMIPQSIYITYQNPNSISTTVTGGKDTDPLLISKISDVDFQAALEEAILFSGVFSDIIAIDQAEYHLEVIIINLKQPIAGFDMTVSLRAQWKLTKLSSSQVIYQDVIASEFTATVIDKFYGVERLRVANEGAARNNIEKGISLISAVKL